MRRITVLSATFLFGAALNTLPGCGAQPAPKSEVVSKPAAAAAEVPATKVVDVAEQKADSPEANATTTAAKQPTEQAAPQKKAKPVDEAQAQTKPPAVAKPSHPAPTAEQLALWNVKEAPKLRLLACYDAFGDVLVQSLAVTTDGTRLAVGGSKLTLWNLKEEPASVDLLQDLKESEIDRPIRTVSFSPDGIWLAAGDQKGTLRIWTLADNKLVKTVKAHDARLTQLAFSPNSQVLATTSYGGEVRLWQLPDAKRIKSFKASDQEITRMSFLSDSLLACASRETAIWNVESAEKTVSLAQGRASAPGIGLNSDRTLLAFQDADSKIQFWDVAKSAALPQLVTGVAAYLIEFSPDGKQIAVAGGDSCVHLFDVASGRSLQVLDAYGDRTSGLKWLPTSDALAIASQNGRLRIWGTDDASAKLNLPPLELPKVAAPSTDSKVPNTPAQSEELIDLRTFPRLPGAVAQFGDFQIASYSAKAKVADAETFYRYMLGQAGWTEKPKSNPVEPSLTFEKQGNVLTVTPMLVEPIPGVGAQLPLLVSLNCSGNFDVQTLPQIQPVKSNATWTSQPSVSYRTKSDLTDLEGSLLKEYHQAGWTAFSALNAMSREEVDSRMMTFVMNGSVLTVMIGRPADAPAEWAVQTSVSITNRSLPIPADSGYVEFDSSTDIRLVANTKMDLNQTMEFYDQRMAAEGWLARKAGRATKDERAWLPYIRGQQDVLIRLVAVPDLGTRIIVGDAEKTSWQLHVEKKSDDKTPKPGLEAADFPVPAQAAAVKFDSDQKEIRFEVPNISPPKLAEELAKTLEPMGWKKDGSGVVSDEYTFITLKNEKPEVQIRIRAQGTTSSVMVGGDGLLWTKPLPTAPVRVSYATWLRRDRKPATLTLLDQFLEEMRKIPASTANPK